VILAISISPDSRPNFGDAPDQTQPNPISRDRPDREPILVMLAIFAMTS
jgi:hypothetical protein